MRNLLVFSLLIFTFVAAACSSPAVPGTTETAAPEPTATTPATPTSQPIAAPPDTATSEPTTAPSATSTSEPTVLPPTETPLPAPAFEAATYRDDVNGYEFDYPVSWSIDGGEQQPRGSYAQFYSWDWKPGDPLDPIPADGTILNVTNQLWDPKNDLEAFINQRKIAWDGSGIKILSEERITLAGDRPAAQFTVQGLDGAQAYFLLMANGETYLVFSGNGDLNLLGEIARTVRPIQ